MVLNRVVAYWDKCKQYIQSSFRRFDEKLYRRMTEKESQVTKEEIDKNINQLSQLFKLFIGIYLANIILIILVLLECIDSNSNVFVMVLSIILFIITPLMLLGLPLYILFKKTFFSRIKIDVLIAGVSLSVLFFALFYNILYMEDSKNFDMLDKNTTGFSTFVYFSIVTITTTGYGDIFPTSFLSKLFVISEIILGIIYFSFGLFVIAKNNDDELNCIINKK